MPAADPNAPAVQVRDLVREFKGGIHAVDSLNLEVAPGEIYAFLGPNGAGKTTTVRILTTLLRPTSGEAFVAGYNVVRHADAVRRLIGVALQEAAIDPLMTGRELLHLQAALHGLRRQAARDRERELLERVGLVGAADRRVGGYSGGMRRRLDLALALVHRPRVLFLDEPTTGLDITSRTALWQEVRSLNDEGTTVFLTTQYLEEAEQLADRVGIIAQGTLVAEGTPDALKANVGEPTVHVELADPESAGRAREALAGLGELDPQDEATPCRVGLRTAAGKAAIGPVIRALDDHRVVVESVEVETPTLDDVFMAVTGSHLEGDARADDGAIPGAEQEIAPLGGPDFYQPVKRG
ncbi:MAG: type transport system ATP-binding protein [Solirubrobacteraceae bacterium]|nr:type transport system ATP-binding protein [Solirubrobacteraceae bacterium]